VKLQTTGQRRPMRKLKALDSIEGNPPSLASQSGTSDSEHECRIGSLRSHSLR
jgi:hypothetical protein